MKVLRLTNSNDILPGTADGRPGLLRERLEGYLGEPVEIVVKAIWPTEALPSTVEKWIEREQPDLVWLGVVNYWYEYQSVPKRMERLFGRVGSMASRLGFRAADTPWLSQNALFRALRGALQRTVGGDPHFTPDHIIQVVGTIARRVLRSEGTVLVIWGPFAHTNYAVSKRGERAAEAMRQRIVGQLRELAGALHFEYFAPDEPYWRAKGEPDFARDRFHYSRQWGEDAVEREFEGLRRAIESQRPELRRLSAGGGAPERPFSAPGG